MQGFCSGMSKVLKNADNTPTTLQNLSAIHKQPLEEFVRANAHLNPDPDAKIELLTSYFIPPCTRNVPQPPVPRSECGVDYRVLLNRDNGLMANVYDGPSGRRLLQENKQRQRRQHYINIKAGVHQTLEAHRRRLAEQVNSPGLLEIGCYWDDWERALPDFQSEPLDDLTLEACAQTARAQGLLYFGVQSGTDCFAGSNLTQAISYGAAQDCYSPCSGDYDQTCGGYWQQNLYFAFPEDVCRGNPCAEAGVANATCTPVAGGTGLDAYRCDCPAHSARDRYGQAACICDYGYTLGSDGACLPAQSSSAAAPPPVPPSPGPPAPPSPGPPVPSSSGPPKPPSLGPPVPPSPGPPAANTTSPPAPTSPAPPAPTSPAPPAPTSPAPPAGLLEIGCYWDDWKRALPDFQSEPLDDLTLEACAQTARAQGLLYFGVQSGTDCFAGSNLTQAISYGAAQDCYSPCSGDYDQTCGGYWQQKLYFAFPEDVCRGNPCAEAGVANATCTPVAGGTGLDAYRCDCPAHSARDRYGQAACICDYGYTLGSDGACLPAQSSSAAAPPPVPPSPGPPAPPSPGPPVPSSSGPPKPPSLGPPVPPSPGPPAANTTSPPAPTSPAPPAPTSPAPPAPTSPAPPAGLLEIGCYWDDWKRALPDFQSEPLDDLTLEACAQTARAQGLLYFGVQSGTDCFAGSNLTQAISYGAAQDCYSPCSGDYDQTCGGYWQQKLYFAFPEDVCRGNPCAEAGVANATCTPVAGGTGLDAYRCDCPAHSARDRYGQAACICDYGYTLGSDGACLPAQSSSAAAPPPVPPSPGPPAPPSPGPPVPSSSGPPKPPSLGPPVPPSPGPPAANTTSPPAPTSPAPPAPTSPAPPAPTSPAPPAGLLEIGCYWDDWKRALPDFQSEPLDDLTLEACAQTALAQGE
ncbi:hypothetical protein HXX76_009815 [Chlamydomonas incerta]|uniref:WSC domain-containing protein n=1 Tax=Chlamydomonas incerta TaxID=51695 RepID=A0A835VZM4_CHLIN|nr:hypothetical protein HXX76_009815 [Chlamydomonas incerta]|eukprot:KAG2430841.1 hypothetical protein HXX76_009815 [Chlamydomonas incerta]